MQKKICPKCQFPSLKSWEELNDEQKMLVIESKFGTAEIKEADGSEFRPLY